MPERTLAVGCQFAEYQIEGIYPFEVSVGRRLIDESRLPEWVFLYATVGTTTGDSQEYAKLLTTLREIRQLSMHPGCILGMVKFRSITLHEASTMHPNIPLLDNVKHVLLITERVKWKIPLRIVGLPRFDRWPKPSSTVLSIIYNHALQMANEQSSEEVRRTRRSNRLAHYAAQQSQMTMSTTTVTDSAGNEHEFDVAVVRDKTGDWMLGCYRVGNRSVGMVGFYKGTVVSGNSPSKKRIVIGGLPGDPTVTVDQWYVDPDHRSNSKLRHGTQLWSLVQHLYAKSGTYRYIVTNATYKGRIHYGRLGFVVSPVAGDLVLTIPLAVLYLTINATNNYTSSYALIIILAPMEVLLFSHSYSSRINFDYYQETDELGERATLSIPGPDNGSDGDEEDDLPPLSTLFDTPIGDLTSNSSESPDIEIMQKSKFSNRSYNLYGNDTVLVTGKDQMLEFTGTTTTHY